MSDSARGLDKLFRPCGGLILFDLRAQDCSVGRYSSGDVKVTPVRGPTERGAQIR
jgi:hypothetical protein